MSRRAPWPGGRSGYSGTEDSCREAGDVQCVPETSANRTIAWGRPILNLANKRRKVAITPVCVSWRSLSGRGHGWMPTTDYIRRLLLSTLIRPKINEKYVGIFG